jgi:hypothetical protein
VAFAFVQCARRLDAVAVTRRALPRAKTRALVEED